MDKKIKFALYLMISIVVVVAILWGIQTESRGALYYLIAVPLAVIFYCLDFVILFIIASRKNKNKNKL